MIVCDSNGFSSEAIDGVACLSASSPSNGDAAMGVESTGDTTTSSIIGERGEKSGGGDMQSAGRKGDAKSADGEGKDVSCGEGEGGGDVDSIGGSDLGKAGVGGK